MRKIDKIKYIRIKAENEDSYSEDIPIGADAQNISMKNGNTLQNTIGNLNIDNDDNITEQLSSLHATSSQLDAKKVSHTELSNYITEKLEDAVNSWLNLYVNPVGSAVTIDKSLSVSGSAADAKEVGNIVSSTINLLKIVTTYPEYTIGGEITYTNTSKGEIVVNGSSTRQGVYLITDIIVLEPGSYRFGFLPSANSNITLQIRDYTTGSDGGNIAGATSSSNTFTITTTKKIRCRLHHAANSNLNNLKLYPILTKLKDWPLFFIPGQSAYDAVTRNGLEKETIKGKIYDGTNINELIETGYYILSASIAYTGSPVYPNAVPALLINFKHTESDMVSMQMFIQTSPTGHIYTRRWAGMPRAWSTWVDLTDRFAFRQRSTTSVDLNNYDQEGWYFFAFNTDYTHDPIGSKFDKVLLVLPEYQNTNSFRVQILFEISMYGAIYARVKKGNPSVWKEWIKISDQRKNQTMSFSFTPTSVNAQGANQGDNLRIMSYNICNFDYDTNPRITIPNEKLFNLKRMFYKANADIICCQEDQQYIDANETKSSDNYVYYPVYPYRYGINGLVLHSKKELSSGTILKLKTTTDTFDENRLMRYKILNLENNKKILIACVHLDTDLTNRQREYNKLFDWLKGRIDLIDYHTSNAVYIPSDITHTIICGDMNSTETSDQTLLTTLVNNNDFILGNGGSIGWFTTCMKPQFYAIDNIIVSNNIIINNIQAYNDQFDFLYSDHVPVIADLTLL